MRKSQKSKKTAGEFESVYTVANAVKRGSAVTRLSMLIMGLGNIAHRQIGKGLLFLLGEVIYIAYMALAGVSALAMLPSLGDRQQQEVWNEAKGIYEYVQGIIPCSFCCLASLLYLSQSFLFSFGAAP